MSDEFVPSEAVLCFSGPLLYAAHIVKVRSKSPFFRVHFEDWGQRYDEWVSGDRICKLTPDNLQYQLELAAEHGSPPTPKKKTRSSRGKGTRNRKLSTTKNQNQRSSHKKVTTPRVSHRRSRTAKAERKPRASRRKEGEEKQEKRETAPTDTASTSTRARRASTRTQALTRTTRATPSKRRRTGKNPSVTESEAEGSTAKPREERSARERRRTRPKRRKVVEPEDQDAVEPEADQDEDGDVDEDEDWPMQACATCPHVGLGRLNVRRAVGTVKSPDKWACQTCNSSESKLCLCCGICFCLPHFRNHTQTKNKGVVDKAPITRVRKQASQEVIHEARTRMEEANKEAVDPATNKPVSSKAESHVLVMDLGGGGGQVACMHCKGVLPLSLVELDPQLVKIRQGLLGMTRGASGHWGLVRGNVLPFLGADAVRKRTVQDKMRSVVNRWAQGSLNQCFHSWRDYVRQNRSMRPPSPGPPQSSSSSSPSSPHRLVHLSDMDALPSSPPKLTRALSMGVQSLLSYRCIGRCGLRNLGNTCYINSVLQAFAKAPGFHKFYLNWRINKQATEHNLQHAQQQDEGVVQKHKDTSKGGEEYVDSRRSPLSEDLARILEVLGGGKAVVFTPDTFLQTVWNLCRQFAGFFQQDAQEFTLFFLDQLRRELSVEEKEKRRLAKQLKRQEDQEDKAGKEKVPQKTQTTPLDDQTTPPLRRSSRRLKKLDEADKKKEERRGAKGGGEDNEEEEGEEDGKSEDFITRLFGGTVVSEVKCGGCNHVSKTPTEFLGVSSLQIPSVEPPRSKRRRGGRAAAASLSLTKCLDYNFGSETLDGDNAYRCSKCKRRCKAVKRSYLGRLPSAYMVFHMVRTKFSTRGMRSYKDKSVIDFPLTGLDMTNYTHHRGQDKERQLYDCFAVICHHGRSMDLGHFTAFGRTKDKTNGWCAYNDDRVSPVTEQEIVSCKDAYMLFYERRHSK